MRAEPLEPAKPYNYFVLDDDVLRDPSHVIRPIVRALVARGASLKEPSGRSGAGGGVDGELHSVET